MLKTLVLVTVLTLGNCPLYAQQTVIVEQGGATLKAEQAGNANELYYDQKAGAPDDALKLRFGTYGSAVAITIDRLSGNADHPTRRELGFIKLGHDDNYPKNVDAQAFEFFLTDPDNPDGDSGEKLIARLGLKKGLEVVGAGTTPPSGGESGGISRMISPGGRYWLQLQADGNYVIYDTTDPVHPKPIFDLWWLLSVLKQLGYPYAN